MMTKLPNLRLALLAGVALIGFASIATAQPIRIGAVYPLTGGVSYDGITKLNGAKLAVDEINAKGGVLGRPLELLSEDGACNPAQSVASAEKLISQSKVVALLGAICSSATGAISETIKKYRIPLVSGVSTAERLTEQANPYFFRATTTTTLNGKSMGETLVKLANGKRIAFIVTSDDWGRSAAQSYGESFKARGAEVVATEYFDRAETDFAALLTKIRASRPDAIVSTGGFQNAANVTKQARQMGLQQVIIGEGAFTSEAYNKLVDPFTDNVFGIIEWVSAIDSPQNKKFIDDYKAKFKEVPTKFSVGGYQTVYILAQAIQKAGATDGDKIRDALKTTNYDGLTGTYRFDEKGQAYDFNMYIVANVNKGQNVVREVVKIPRQPATAK
jgi:branched-chain amino acid transport system substrate-binding protein